MNNIQLLIHMNNINIRFQIISKFMCFQGTIFNASLIFEKLARSVLDQLISMKEFMYSFVLFNQLPASNLRIIRRFVIKQNKNI